MVNSVNYAGTEEHCLSCAKFFGDAEGAHVVVRSPINPALCFFCQRQAATRAREVRLRQWLAEPPPLIGTAEQVAYATGLRLTAMEQITRQVQQRWFAAGRPDRDLLCRLACQAADRVIAGHVGCGWWIDMAKKHHTTRLALGPGTGAGTGAGPAGYLRELLRIEYQSLLAEHNLPDSESTTP